MKKVLYTKFSRERSLPFQIATSIVREDGEKKVIKQALTSEAFAHVERMDKNQERLRDFYEYPGIRICPCTKTGEGVIEFLFLEGTSLENLLTEHVQQKNFEQVRRDVKQLYDILISARGLRSFEPTEEFERMFGSPRLPQGQMAAPLSNLDMLFANLLAVTGREEQSSQFYLVDYEWVFDFMIPISYIFARSLMLHGALQTLPGEQLAELYAIGGVRMEDVPVYHEMEVRFQQYVSGEEEVRVLSRLYPKMNTGCLRLDYWNTEHVLFEVKLLGVPYEEGAKPERLYFSLNFQGQVEMTCRIPDTGRYKEFLFQPVDTECVFKLQCARGVTDNGEEELDVSSNNGQLQEDDTFYFQQAPVIHIENKGYREITMDYLVYHRNDFLVKQTIDFRLENRRLHKELRRYTGRLHNRVLRKLGSVLKKKEK